MTDIEEYEEEDYESDLKKELLAKTKKPEQLKPCPFCGYDVELNHYKANNNDWWYIACRYCGIAMDPLMWNSKQTKEETITIWNRRILNGMPVSQQTMTARDEE